MTKIIWGINIPYQSKKVDFEAMDKLPLNSKEWVMVPCIRIHKQLSFELCDVCGTQIIGGRRKRRLTTCCPEHNKIKWDTTNGIILERERKLQGVRPTFFWTQIRDECFERDDYKCRRCGMDITEHLKKGIKPPEAHHIIQIKDGGSNELSNLKTLCYDCHKIEHSRSMKIRKLHIPLDV